MTDTQQPQLAATLTTKFGTLTALSIDLVEYGALIIDDVGDVLLLPWHAVNKIEFHDDSAFQPQVATSDPDIPARHEGSE